MSSVSDHYGMPPSSGTTQLLPTTDRVFSVEADDTAQKYREGRAKKTDHSKSSHSAGERSPKFSLAVHVLFWIFVFFVAVSVAAYAANLFFGAAFLGFVTAFSIALASLAASGWLARAARESAQR